MTAPSLELGMAPSQDTAMASPMKSEDPPTKVNSPAAAAAPRKGKALWAKAKVKTRALRLVHVRHELEHRAQEKIFFGVVEHGLAWSQRFVATNLLAVGESIMLRAEGKGLAKVTSKVRGWAQAAVRKILRRKKAAPLPPPPPATGVVALTFGLHAVHVLIPLAGTYLLAHMAHHDWHRATRELKEQGARKPSTALFFVGAVCDAIDALAHLAILLHIAAGWMAAVDHGAAHARHDDHGHSHGHDDGHHDHHHHVEHMLHEASMYSAIVACCCMMLGEFLTHGEGGHGHGHGGHGHGPEHGAAAEEGMDMKTKLKLLAKKEATAKKEK